MTDTTNNSNDIQEVKLADLTKEEIENLDYKTAQALCVQAGLKAKGSLADLIDSLILTRFGSSKTFVPGNTKCIFCGAVVMVKSTKKFTTPNGDQAITRNLKCKGPRAHTYPDTQVV